MKKLFIALCDIMAVSTVVALIALAVWGLGVLFECAFLTAAKSVFIVAAVVAVVDTALSYIVWDNGGGPDDTEEGYK